MVKGGVTVWTSEVVVASVECAMLMSACRMSDAAALAYDGMTSSAEEEEEDSVLLLVVVVSQQRVMKLLDDG